MALHRHNAVFKSYRLKKGDRIWAKRGPWPSDTPSLDQMPPFSTYLVARYDFVTLKLNSVVFANNCLPVGRKWFDAA